MLKKEKKILTNIRVLAKLFVATVGFFDLNVISKTASLIQLPSCYCNDL